MSENYSGDLLKSLRKEQKMSQTKLAELSGISQSALVKYCLLYTSPSPRD